MRILITGSRHWGDRDIMVAAFEELARWTGGAQVTLVHGAAKGADRMAGELAMARGWTVEPHPADWRAGKQAGHMRNQSMVDLGAALCVAFPTLSSKGTWDCVQRAVQAGIPVWIPSQVRRTHG